MTPEPTGKRLQVKSLTKSFGRRLVVRQISFRAAPGEALGILGPNGAGKTTLFHLITGLLRPESGHIFLGEQDITALPAYQRARLGSAICPRSRPFSVVCRWVPMCVWWWRPIRRLGGWGPVWMSSWVPFPWPTCVRPRPTPSQEESGGEWRSPGP